MNSSSLQGSPGKDGVPGIRGDKGDVGFMGPRGLKVGRYLVFLRPGRPDVGVGGVLGLRLEVSSLSRGH